MVRLVTTYDSDLKEKVFKLRGDERYAWTTDTVMTITEGSQSIEGYSVTIQGKVLRDRGSSSLVLYDNNTVLKIIDISDDDSTVSLGSFVLSWGETHNLYLVYKGNKLCLASQSEKVGKQKDIPARYRTIMEFSSENRVIDNVGTTAVTVNMTVNGEIVSNLNNKDVLFYLDDEYVTTVNTGDGNTATANIVIGSVGLHEIKALVQSAYNLNGAEVSDDWSVGYIVALTTVPTPYIVGVDNTFAGTIKDYFGNGANKSLALYIDNVSSASATSSNGEVTFTVSKSLTASLHSAKIVCGAYVSAVKSFTIQNITGLSVTANPTIISENYPSLITATVQGVNVGNPDVMFGSHVVPSVNGVATYELQGSSSAGNTTVSVSASNYSESVTLERTEQYFHRGDTNYTYNKNISSNNTYAKKTNAYLVTGVGEYGNMFDYDITFKGLSTSYDYQIELECVSDTTFMLYVGGSIAKDGVVKDTYTGDTGGVFLSKGNKLTIIKTNNRMIWRVGGNVIANITGKNGFTSTNYNQLTIKASIQGKSIAVNDIKLKKYSI